MTPEQRTAQRRESFLEAGLNIFGNEGFHAATVRKICKEAGLTDRYFYESYSSMEELLVDVYERCLQGILRNVQASVMTLTPETDIEELLRQLLDGFFREMEDSRVAKVCMFEAEGVSDEMHAMYNDYIRRFVMVLINASKQKIGHWPLNDAETEVIGNATIGGIIQVTRNWVVNNYHLPRESLVSGVLVLIRGTQMALSAPGKTL
ncbi:MAG: TetR/AcrR family transcriptional regulator [Thalassolituus sp.]